jgi:hypothetical protein
MNPGTSRSTGTAGPKISSANRKRCSVCGADVTFGQKVRLVNGDLACPKCAGIAEQAPDGHDAPLPDTLGDTDVVVEAAGEKPSLKNAAKASGTPVWEQPAFWGVCGIAAIALALLLAAYLILRPSWEDQHRDELVARRQEASNLLANGKPKEAYYKFKDLHELVGDRKLSRALLKQEMQVAGEEMAKAEQLAAPEIAKEEAAERGRLAAARRAEEERQRREREAVARQQEEKRRQESERREAQARADAAAKEKARLALARDAVKNSPEFAKLKAEASRIYLKSRTDLIGEDSAYRSLSAQSEAARDLLAVYVKLQGMLNDVRVEADVDRIIRLSDVRLIGEDSAIRAIYKKDEAFLELLGTWCKVLDKRHPGIKAHFDRHHELATAMTRVDDSAPRAISRYTGTSVDVLKEILSKIGLGADAARVSAAVSVANIGEDSAWRAAMRNAEAISQMLLAILAQGDAAKAAEIKAHAAIEAIGEDSALRAHRLHKEMVVRTLKELVESL